MTVIGSPAAIECGYAKTEPGTSNPKADAVISPAPAKAIPTVGESHLVTRSVSRRGVRGAGDEACVCCVAMWGRGVVTLALEWSGRARWFADDAGHVRSGQHPFDVAQALDA